MEVEHLSDGICPPQLSTRRKRSSRRAVSLVEVQVAMVTLGILLSGLGPITALYIRQLRETQQRFSPQSVYYLVPPSDFWVRKLGVAASLTTQDPGTSSLPDPLPSTNTVLLDSLQKSVSTQEVTAGVDVQPTQ